MENYAKKLRIEALTMTDMARRQILPAVTAYTRELTASALEKKRLSPDIACDYEEGTAKKLSACAGTLYHAVEQLQEDLAGAETRGDAAEQALFYKDTVLTDMAGCPRSGRRGGKPDGWGGLAVPDLCRSAVRCLTGQHKKPARPRFAGRAVSLIRGSFRIRSGCYWRPL